MNSYPTLIQLFTTVLQSSLTIEGRVYVTYRKGRELNSDLLNEVLNEVNTNLPQVKYPLALITPPVLHGDLTQADGWASFEMSIAFLRTSYYNSDNTIAALNENTQTSNRPIIEDWNDMGNEAVNFIRLLSQIVRVNNNHQVFRLPKESHTITPVSSVGVDRASGVRLDFIGSLFLGCDVTGYGDDLSFINTISLT